MLYNRLEPWFGRKRFPIVTDESLRTPTLPVPVTPPPLRPPVWTPQHSPAETPAPVKRAKRRGKYGPSGRLHWVLEIDGQPVTTKVGSVRRFPTKSAALAYA